MSALAKDDSNNTYTYEYAHPITGKVYKQTKTYMRKNRYIDKKIEMIQILKKMPQGDTYLEFYNEFLELVERHKSEPHKTGYIKRTNL